MAEGGIPLKIVVGGKKQSISSKLMKEGLKNLKKTLSLVANQNKHHNDSKEVGHAHYDNDDDVSEITTPYEYIYDANEIRNDDDRSESSADDDYGWDSVLEVIQQRKQEEWERRQELATLVATLGGTTTRARQRSQQQQQQQRSSPVA